VLALAADHVVRDAGAFIAACRQGLVAAESGRIVTLGVKPERAATEYEVAGSLGDRRIFPFELYSEWKGKFGNLGR
jgi:hypothetical protein